MEPSPILQVEGLQPGPQPPLSFAIQAGEVLAVVGGNGAGKSRLLRAILGLVPAAGRIWLAGTEITALGVEQRARAGIGYVPEGRRIFPGMSVADNLDVASHSNAAGRAADRARVYALFPDLFPRHHEKAWRLSGGQQQMLAIGRAMMARPRLLLLDEPSLGLSPRLAAAVLTAVRRLADTNTAVLLADAALDLALAVADQALVLRQGLVVLGGTAETVAMALDPASAAGIGRLRQSLFGGDGVSSDSG